MIRLHHLNQSRSFRILWLLEEIGEPYELIRYQRDQKTQFAPESLKEIHPLGKSPVVELDGKIIAESGAITEILIDRFASERLQPVKESAEYVEYLQWVHFAESSLMVPLLLDLFLKKDGCTTNFLHDYVAIENAKVLGYLDASLKGKTYLVAEKLTGADFMVSFIVDMLAKQDVLGNFPSIAQYAKQLANHSSWQRAQEIERG